MLAEGCGNARSLLCPYHARVYGLDGTLKRMGGEDGFPDFDQQAHGLIQVVAEERGGLLFVTQKQPLSAGALGDLPDLIAPGWEVFEYSSYPDDAN